MPTSKLAEIVNKYHSEILSDWVSQQVLQFAGKRASITEKFAEASRTFLALMREAMLAGDEVDVTAPTWSRVRSFLDDFGAKRVEEGFTPSEVAMFIFSLKGPIFNRLRTEYSGQPQVLAQEMWSATLLVDKLGLYTTEVYQKNRDIVIQRQQQDMLELSTPVVRLWEGILALPLIGTLDSARTQVVMQNLLEAIVQSGAEVAILDITGVPTVDTLVAQHLLKTVAAARLMGADCIISGIRPQIAQTIIHLGVDLSEVTTKATLADAFQLALKRVGVALGKAAVKA